MKIKRLSLKNIRSYEDAELTFPDGSFLLSGDVGSGKTSILAAIEYAFFGLQPGQKGSALLRNQADAGEVVLELEIDHKHIQIERRLKRTKKTVVNDYATLTINEQVFSSSLTEIKTKILEVLGYPAEFIRKNNLLYRYTVYTPQEQMKNIILEDPETRLNLIGHIFGIDKYKRIRTNSAIFSNYLKEEAKSLEGNSWQIEETLILIAQLKTHISQLTEQTSVQFSNYEKTRLDLSSMKSELKELELKLKEKEVLSKEIEKTNLLISTKAEILSSLTREKNSLARQIAESKTSFKEEDYQVSLTDLKKTQEELDVSHSNLMAIGAQMLSIEKEIVSNLSKKERIFKIDICPTCLQNVEHNHKYNIINETEREVVAQTKQRELLKGQESLIKAELSTKKIAISQLQDKIKKQEEILSKQKIVSTLIYSLSEKEKQEKSLTSDISFLERHCSELKLQLLNHSRFVSQHLSKQKELLEKEQAERRAEILLAELRKEKALAESELTKQENALKSKELIRDKLNKIKELQDWFENSFLSLIGFIERSVLLRLREEFSKFFSKWFQMLISDTALDVRLDENFTPIILQGDVEMEYSFLSGGERTAIALAYRLSLNQLLNSLFGKIKTRDILILDEPTEGFSEAQLERIRDVFTELNAGQLIIVSHEQKIEGFVSHVIKLKKQAGSSIVDLTSTEKSNRKT